MKSRMSKAPLVGTPKHFALVAKEYINNLRVNFHRNAAQMTYRNARLRDLSKDDLMVLACEFSRHVKDRDTSRIEEPK